MGGNCCYLYYIDLLGVAEYIVMCQYVKRQYVPLIRTVNNLLTVQICCNRCVNNLPRTPNPNRNTVDSQKNLFSQFYIEFIDGTQFIDQFNLQEV